MGWVVAVEHVDGGQVGLRRLVDFSTDELAPIIGEFYERVYDLLPSDAGGQAGHNAIAYVPVGATTADMLVGVEWDGSAPEGLEAS